VRAFGAGGASRLVGYGRCNMTTELDDVRRQLNVPVVNAMIDGGFKASEVYRFCLATGRTAMKGDDAEWFLSQDPRTEKTMRRVWRRVLVDPSLGARRAKARRHLSLFQWSNPSLKDHPALFTHGGVGQWTIPRMTGGNYVDQMTAKIPEAHATSARLSTVRRSTSCLSVMGCSPQQSVKLSTRQRLHGTGHARSQTRPGRASGIGPDERCAHPLGDRARDPPAQPPAPAQPRRLDALPALPRFTAAPNPWRNPRPDYS
jgi:hypothetical protein